MNRRDTLSALLAIGAVTGPLGSRAQTTPSAPSRTLGILTLVSLASSQDDRTGWLPGFRAALKSLGWIEGKNLVIEGAFADYNAERLAVLAEELVRKRVDLIWTFLPDAAIAAARATRTIPIVFANVSWPVDQGLIESFARPGRNVTGVATYTGIEVSTKRLQFLKEVAPAASRLSWILGSATEPTVDGARYDIRPQLDAAARSLGYEVRYHAIQKDEDVDPVFADILAWRAQAVAVAGTAATFRARERIAAFGLSNRLPIATAGLALVEAGMLLYYNAIFTAGIARSADYVDRIFRGARPADLAVDRPSTYSLVINLKTARALGLEIPQSLLLRADRVIE